MKFLNARVLTLVTWMLCFVVLTSTANADGAASPEGHIPTLYVIGDSTAAAYPADRAPLTGWAQVLQERFDPARLQVDDRARSGRSSKSFYDEGAWTPIREALQPGDWVFIQFAHNDEKKDDPTRYTDPATTFPEHLRRYVDETRAAGAKPVLLTPINRNHWASSRRMEDTHGDYPDATRALAREMGVPLIDLHRLTRKRLTRLGPKRSAALFLNLAPGEQPNYPEGKQDNTHLQESGAREVSALAVKGIRRLPLRAYLLRQRLPRYAHGYTRSGRITREQPVPATARP